jgi:hypothetical protein
MQDFVVAALREIRFKDLEPVAKATKVSKWTIQKIRLRQIVNPGVRHVEPLYHYLKALESKRRRAA